MSKALKILEELKTTGALGGSEEAPQRVTVEEVTLEEGAPSPALVDARGDRTMAELRHLSSLLKTIATSAAEAAESCDRLCAVWAADSAPTAAPARAEVSEAPVAPAAPPAPAPEAMTPEEAERARELARKKVRGEDLTPAELARAYGEPVPIEQTDPDAPPIALPDLKPSYPAEEEVEGGEVPQES